MNFFFQIEYRPTGELVCFLPRKVVNTKPREETDEGVRLTNECCRVGLTLSEDIVGENGCFKATTSVTNTSLGVNLTISGEGRSKKEAKRKVAEQLLPVVLEVTAGIPTQPPSIKTKNLLDLMGTWSIIVRLYKNVKSFVC